MDEFLFRSSQKLDSLQIQLGLAASHSKDVFHQFSEHSKLLVSQVWNNSKTLELKEAFKEIWFYLIDVAEHVRYKIQFYSDPRRIYLGALGLFGRNWTKREIYIGLAGFVVGSIIGVVIGLSYHRQESVTRYMQAVQCRYYSGSESILVSEDAKAPHECAEHEVLIDVKACSVQVLDNYISHGYGRTLRRIMRKYYENSSELPVTLGRDCTGIVTDIGKNVRRIEIGDEVWLTVPFWAQGTMSQTIIVPEIRVSKKPRNVGFEGACSVPYAGCAALSALEKCNITFENAQEKRVLIHGSCTPVGCILIQILKYWGADVSSTCNKRALPVALALGAEDIIIMEEEYITRNSNSDNHHLLEELKKRHNFDAIILTWDVSPSNEELQKFCKCIISTTPEKLPSDSYGFFRRYIFQFCIWLRWHLESFSGISLNEYDEVHMCHSTLDQLTELVKNGHLQTVVDKVYLPQDIDIALSHLESTRSIGSTIITFR
ncbi:reticulon-4-interacting protein 1, mitochondrial-like [Coccinella septempunctata]|uniref:reticulon-4-interacting protein 1, mitochondrial-like n=1 Tax=Coccinella septempunctata TaxID=41139 RepID=UPI001D09589C|nr:reticulon-4-interacting protein 1, mitochondrial-like [Coccinella septempunctata]